MAPFCSVAVFGRPAVHTLLSVVLHIAVAACFLDDLFSSSMRDVGQLRPHQSPAQPLASRVVLISIDSATADVLFSGTSRQLYPSFRQGDDSVSLPFLSTVLRHACWGVKHVTGPTETRPTHVEMLAGVPEDPASVRTGWRHSYNSSYDTVLKGATHAWQWAYEDVLADTPDAPHIHSFVLPKALEVYPHGMDQWVSDSLAGVLAEAQRDPAKKEQLAAERGVFFLHFLGLDSMGHHFGADSWEYAQKLEHVDACVKRAKEAFDQYFPDGRTAFIITSDHGMAGTRHGGGSPVETRTPFIVFGAGANEHCSTPTPPKRRVVSSRNLHRSEEEEVAYVSKAWGLDPQGRMDIAPADVSMLMASLLSSPLPVHSEGTVPIEYMSTDRAARAHAMFTNVLQARERVQGAAAVRRSRCHGWFSEWGGAGEAEAMFAALSQHMEGRDYEAVLQRSGGLVELLHEGALYYREYDKALMLAAVAFAYTVWALYSVAVVAAGHEVQTPDHPTTPGLPLPICIACIAYTAILPFAYARGLTPTQALPWLLPPVALPFILTERRRAARYVTSRVTPIQASLLLLTLLTITAGYHHRALYGATFVALAAGGMAISSASPERPPWGTAVLMALAGSCTFLPSVGSNTLYVAAPAAILCSALSAAFLLSRTAQRRAFLPPVILWLCSAALVAARDAQPPDRHFTAGRWGACFLLATGFLLPLFGPTDPCDRLEYILLCLQAPTALLSEGHEQLFLVIFCCVLSLFVRHFVKATPVTLSAVLLLLLGLGLLSTQSLADLGALRLASAPRFPDGGKLVVVLLMTLKVLIPLMCVGAAFDTALGSDAQRQSHTFVLATGAMGVCGIAFAADITTHGPWRDVVVSAVPYAIAALFPSVLVFLQATSLLFTVRPSRPASPEAWSPHRRKVSVLPPIVA